MRMICFLSENINLGVYILLRMYSHLNTTSRYVLNELVHAVLHLFVVFSLLDVLFNVREEFIKCFVGIRSKQQALLRGYICQFVDIDTNKKSYFGCLLDKLSNAEIS